MILELLAILVEFLAAVLHVRSHYDELVGNGLGGRRFPPAVATDGTMLNSRTMTTLRSSVRGPCRGSAVGKG